MVWVWHVASFAASYHFWLFPVLSLSRLSSSAHASKYTSTTTLMNVTIDDTCILQQFLVVTMLCDSFRSMSVLLVALWHLSVLRWDILVARQRRAATCCWWVVRCLHSGVWNPQHDTHRHSQCLSTLSSLSLPCAVVFSYSLIEYCLVQLLLHKNDEVYYGYKLTFVHCWSQLLTGSMQLLPSAVPIAHCVVCLSVGWACRWALQKLRNQSRCCFGADSCAHWILCKMAVQILVWKEHFYEVCLESNRDECQSGCSYEDWCDLFAK